MNIVSIANPKPIDNDRAGLQPLGGYVLYLEHDNREHDVWIFRTAKQAQAALHRYAYAFLEESGEPVDGLTIAQLIERLDEFNECPRIFRCGRRISSALDPVTLQLFHTA